MKKIAILLSSLLMVTSVMIGCTSNNTAEEKSEPTPNITNESVGDMTMENTFKGTILNIEVDPITDVTLATIKPNEGEEILSLGNTASVGLMRDHNYTIGDIVTVAYGKAFSDNGKLEFDNVTIKE